MIISQELNEKINAQIGSEFGASMQYLHIAAYFAGETLPAMAEFFFKQAEEEGEHAMKFLHFLLETGAEVKIPAIAESKSSFTSAEEAVGAAVEWEKQVTREIYALKEIAIKDKDYISQNFLDWYVNEQLEEMSSMDTLFNMVKRVGEKNLFMLEGPVSKMRGDD